MPWAIPVEGSESDALAVAVEQYDMAGLVRPLMVIDYGEDKIWRVGRDEDGWYLSDSATVKMGLMTGVENIPKEPGRIASPVDESLELEVPEGSEESENAY
jgi:hypothetical protein